MKKLILCIVLTIAIFMSSSIDILITNAQETEEDISLTSTEYGFFEELTGQSDEFPAISENPIEHHFSKKELNREAETAFEEYPPTDEWSDTLYDWEKKLLPEVERILEEKQIYSFLTSEEKSKVNDFYRLNQEYMLKWAERGYSITESMPLAKALQEHPFTFSDIESLVELYGCQTTHQILHDFSQYAYWRSYMQETFQFAKHLLLDGWSPSQIALLYDTADVLEVDVELLCALNEEDYTSGTSNLLSADELQTLLEISTLYGVKRSILISYLETHGISTEELSQILPSLVHTMSSRYQELSGGYWYGFNVQSYPVSPTTAAGMQVLKGQGTLIYEDEEIVLPGKNGLDLTLSVRYDSSVSKQGVYQYRVSKDQASRGQSAIGTNTMASYHKTALHDFAYGWHFNFSRIYTPGVECYRILSLSDGRNFTIQTSPSSTKVKINGLYTEDLRMERDYSYNFENRSVTYKYALFYSNGKKEFFDNDGDVVRILDLHGNDIKFDYSNNKNNVLITDSLGRNTTIQRTENAVTITLPDQTQKIYELIDATAYNSAGASQTFKNVGSITDQNGDVTQFTYFNGADSFNYFHSFTSVKPYEFAFSRLEKVTYPTGATSNCIYEIVSEKMIYGYEHVHKVVRSYDEHNSVIFNDFQYHYATNSTSFSTIHREDGTIIQYSGNAGLINWEKVTDAGGNILHYVSTDYTNYHPTSITQSFGGSSSKKHQITAKYNNNCCITEEMDGHYGATYTYGANDIMLTKSYKQNSNTTILQENILTGDEKNISKTRIKSNNIIKSEIDYEYDSYGNIIKKTEHPTTNLSIITEYQYTYLPDGRYQKQTIIRNIKDADGKNLADITVCEYYDVMGRLEATKDALGTTTYYTYDAAGRITKITAPDGGTTHYVYNTTQNTIEVTQPNGKKILYQYDSLGGIKEALAEIGDSYQKIQEYTYDNLHRVNTLTEYRKCENPQEIYVTTRSYDALDRVTEETVRQGDIVVSQTQYAYDESSSPTLNYVTQTRTGDGSITPAALRQGYDLRGVLKEEVILNGAEEYNKTEYTHDYVDNVLTVSTDKSRDLGKPFAAQYTYDYANRPVSETNIDGAAKTLTYDGMGRKTAETDFLNKTMQYAYDAASRVVKVTAPFDGAKTTDTKTYYDANGNVIRRLSRADETQYTVTENTYDAMNRVTRAVNYNTRTAGTPDASQQTAVSYTYDNMGNILTQVLEDGENSSVTQYEYNSLNQCIKQTDALGQEETFTYNLIGDMLTHTDRNGTAFAYAYNAYRAPLSITAQNGEHSQSVSYTYDPVGNRKTMTDDTGTTSYTYDFLSRLTSEEKDGKLKAYRYNKYGERTNIRVTDGNMELYALDYVYDAQSRNTGLSGLSLIAQLAYDANGRMTKKTLGNVVTDYTYNDMGAVTSLTARRGTDNLYRSVYGYERSGNLISDEMTGKSASLTKTYTYDGMNRLTGETIDGTAGGQPLSHLVQYTFDAKNNITKVQRSLTDTTGEETGTYDLNNRLLTAKTQTGDGEDVQDFTYDPNGSRFASLGSSLSPTAPSAETAELAERDENAGLYEYDLFNRLIGYQKGDVSATYTYNGDGQRMSKTVNGKTTQFIWDGMNMIVEFSSTGGDIAAYIYGPSGLLARNSSQGGLLIYTTNAHGDVTAATKQLGGAAMEYHYDAYGNVIHTTNVTHTATLADNPFLYCGEYTDFETGFIYLRNRYYDPEQRRFITEDPIHDGSNWYIYCGNNPVMFVDLLGLAGEIISEPDQYEYQFSEYISLRFNAERWGADVSYSGRTQKATIKFPNRSAVSFKVGEEGTYIDSNGTMQVKSSVFKKKTKITQVYSKKVRDKMLTMVNFESGKNVNLVWNGYTIGNIGIKGEIRHASTVPTDGSDKVLYGRFGDLGKSIDLAAGDIAGQFGDRTGALYSAATSYHNPWSGVDFDVSYADTKLRINDRNLLYYYVTVFLAAKGDSISFVGSTYGGT